MREQAHRASDRSALQETRIGIVAAGDLATIALFATRALGDLGASVITLSGNTESEQAVEANNQGVDLLLSLDIGNETRVAYYRGHAYESVAGRELSSLLAAHLSTQTGLAAHAEGMYLALLRETKMVAVLVELGPLDKVLEQAEEIALAVTQAACAWIAGHELS